MYSGSAAPPLLRQRNCIVVTNDRMSPSRGRLSPSDLHCIIKRRPILSHNKQTAQHRQTGAAPSYYGEPPIIAAASLSFYFILSCFQKRYRFFSVPYLSRNSTAKSEQFRCRMDFLTPFTNCFYFVNFILSRFRYKKARHKPSFCFIFTDQFPM